jgi:hypothetical protein
VTINGVTFPSPVRMAWELLTPQERSQRLALLANAGWDHLASYEKTLLGIKTKPAVSDGWRDYLESKQLYADANPNHPTLDRTQVLYLVAAEEKQHPGFKQDWLIASQPKVRRFETTTLYQEMPSPAKRAWDAEISASAKAVARALADPNRANKGDVRKAWKDYVKNDVPHYLADNPALKKYLAPFGPDFLPTLPFK